jgi:uncharacterized phage-associated protein
MEVKMIVSVHDVADYCIIKVDREAGDDITHLKLQKLVYYAQAWYLAMQARPLFDNAIEAWAHGPVCREVYGRFRHYSWNPIPAAAAFSREEELDEGLKDFLDEVWEVYGQYSAAKLEHMTHEEAPWVAARAGAAPGSPGREPIGEDLMRDYYAMRMQARKRIREN